MSLHPQPRNSFQPRTRAGCSLWLRSTASRCAAFRCLGARSAGDHRLRSVIRAGRNLPLGDRPRGGRGRAGVVPRLQAKLRRSASRKHADIDGGRARAGQRTGAANTAHSIAALQPSLRGRTGTPRCHHAQGLPGLHEFLSNEREREQEIQGVHGRAVAHELKMATSPPTSRVPKKSQKQLKGEVMKIQKEVKESVEG